MKDSLQYPMKIANCYGFCTCSNGVRMTASHNGSAVTVYDQNMTALATFGNFRYINQIKFDDTGKRLVIKCCMHVVEVWDVMQQKQIFSFEYPYQQQQDDGILLLSDTILNIVKCQENAASCLSVIDIKTGHHEQYLMPNEQSTWVLQEIVLDKSKKNCYITGYDEQKTFCYVFHLKTRMFTKIDLLDRFQRTVYEANTDTFCCIKDRSMVVLSAADWKEQAIFHFDNIDGTLHEYFFSPSGTKVGVPLLQGQTYILSYPNLKPSSTYLISMASHVCFDDENQRTLIGSWGSGYVFH